MRRARSRHLTFLPLHFQTITELVLLILLFLSLHFFFEMPKYLLLSFSSWVWRNHQGATLRPNPVSWLSFSVRAQPALRVDHRGGPWKHHQVWAALSIPLSSSTYYILDHIVLSRALRIFPIHKAPGIFFSFFAVVFITCTGCCVISPYRGCYWPDGWVAAGWEEIPPQSLQV